MIGWPDGNTLCATLPLHTVFTEGYPETIQSSDIYSPEERSNSAHHCPLSFTPLLTLRPKEASTQGIPPLLSPGPHRPAPQPEREMMHGQHRVQRVQGVPQGMYYAQYTRGSMATRVSGRHSREYYTHHGNPGYTPPPW